MVSLSLYPFPLIINCYIFLYPTKLFNNSQVLEKFNMDNVDVRDIERLTNWDETWGRVEVSRNCRRGDKTTWASCSVYVSIFGAASRRWAGWAEEDWQKHVHQVLRAWMAMAQYWQRDDHVNHIFFQVFVNSQMSIGCVNQAGYIGNILEARIRKTLIEQVVLSPSAFDLQLYFRALTVCPGKSEGQWSCYPLFPTVILACDRYMPFR